MAHYVDLSSCDYLPDTADLGFVAVGWLEANENYSVGEVDGSFFDKLCELLAKPWNPPISCSGGHACSLCRFTGGGAANRNGVPVSAKAYGFLFVPFGETIFVAPSNIAHYVDAHGYCPPDVFRQAVMACPATGSIEFKRALVRTPVKEWLSRISAPSLTETHG
jgi:hypothetical protein